MSALRRPGVEVDVFGAGAPVITAAAPANYFVVNQFEFGPIDRPLFTTDEVALARYFGAKVAYSRGAEDLQNFFAESQGAGRAWVSRVFDLAAEFATTTSASALAAATSITVVSATGIVAGDLITIGANAANANRLVASVAGTTINLDATTALGAAVASGDAVTRAAETAADYSASAPVKDTQGTPVTILTVKANYPGAIGNGFRIESVPGGINTAVDRLLNIRTRAGVEPVRLVWRGWPAASSAATIEAIKTANTAAVAAINAAADQDGSDVRIEIAAAYTAAGYLAAAEAKLETTGTSILLKPHATAIALAGGGNGRALDQLAGSATDAQRLAATPDSVFVGATLVSGAKTGLFALADRAYGTGAVGIAGRDSTAIWTAIDEHCQTWDRLGLLQIPGGTSPEAGQTLKATRGPSFKTSVYFGTLFKNGAYHGHQGFVAGLGARRTAGLDAEGGIKASWTGRLSIEGVEQRGGRDIIDDGYAEMLFDDTVRINWTRLVPGRGYRLEANKLAQNEGATSRVHHLVSNHVFQYSIEPALYDLRDRTIDRGGKLIEDFKDAVNTFLRDYAPGMPAPKGDTFWDAAIIVNKTTLSDLRTAQIRAHGEFSYAEKAERVTLTLAQVPVKTGF